MRKGGQRKGERLEEQQRGLKERHEKEENQKEMQLILLSKKMPKERRVAPKQPPGAPARAAVINPGLTGTESRCRLPGDTCKRPAGHAHTYGFVLTRSASPGES